MPSFALAGPDGEVRSRDLVGRGPLVVYFYPRDDTPGCTAEACAYRDQFQSVQEAGATIVGISPDTVQSHRRFAEKHGLPFLLLADPDRTVFGLFGVRNDLWMPGRETFVMDPAGIVRHHVDSMFPARHVREALQAVERIRLANHVPAGTGYM